MPKSAPASPAARAEPAAAPEAAGGTLVVKIGRGWANIRIDGKKRPSTGYGGAFRLEPGRHEVSVYRSDGRYRPRTVEVSADGALYELRGGARRRLAGGEILFRMPGPDETDEGWLPNETEEARAAPRPARDG